jgi:hypothetical protein
MSHTVQILTEYLYTLRAILCRHAILPVSLYLKSHDMQNFEAMSDIINMQRMCRST